MIMKVAGKDGTRSFQAIHPKSFLNQLPPSALKGVLDPMESGLSAPDSHSDSSAPESTSTKATISRPVITSLEQVLNLNDFETAAETMMEKQGYGYYASAANDEITKNDNIQAFSRVWLRPRILVDVKDVDTSCTLLGTKCSFPLFISPAAMAGLAHPDAEVALAHGAAKNGVIQIVANMASRDLEDITNARVPTQTQWYQVYINPNRSKSEDAIKRAVANGCKALAVTVDTAVLGRRERDMRNKIEDDSALSLVQQDQITNRSSGVAAALGTISDPSLSWKDLEWLRSLAPGLPIILKGVQTGEDAVLAAQNGVEAILVSNHGGRNLDHARPSLDILVEVMLALNEAGLKHKIDVFLDGGVRRGTDIYKALAIGAKGVGIGRPAMYSLVFGEAGIDKCLRMLKDEFEMCMRLMGRCKVSEIQPRDILFKPTVPGLGSQLEHSIAGLGCSRL